MKRCAVFLVALSVSGVLRAENWHDFRGPTGQGHYEGARSLPIEWSKTKNVVWKQAIPGKGWSSPIVHEGRVYLTTAVPLELKEPTPPKESKEEKDTKAKAKKPAQEQSLQALCLDAATGKILWQTEVFRQDAKAPSIHGKNSHASPSPLTDGKHVFVHFGHQGTACLDLDGKVVWRNRDLGYAPVHGNGGTPIFVDETLVFSADGGDKQFVCALDKATGKVVWKTDRKSESPRKFSFSTPLLITTKSGRQIVSPASDAVVAYDPAGTEIWRAKYDGYSVIPRPVFGHGLVFISTSYNNPVLMAIKPDGQGDVTKSHVAWTLNKGAPHTPSPLLVGKELYVVSDRGLASCIDALTGKVHWQERVGMAYSASPFHWNDKIYFQSEDGTTTVVRASTKFEPLATSKVDERTFASYAVADGSIFLRTETQLYRLQESSSTAGEKKTSASGAAKKLFDGKTLTGWEGDTDKTWRIEDGAIVGGSLDNVVPRNEFLCTKASYGDFELTAKFRLVGDPKRANAGIQFRTKRIPNHHEVSGYQADIGQHYWGALYDESRRKRVLAQPAKELLDKIVKYEDWNDYRILCEGPRIQLWLNGVQTVDYTEKDDNIERTGIIGLQIHGGAKAKAAYKDIVLSPR